MFTVYDEMRQGLAQMQHLARAFEKELPALPKGSLSRRQRHDKTYFYYNLWDGRKSQKSYLNLSNKSDRNLLQKLQRRRFIEQSLPILKTNILALQRALQRFTPYDPENICAQLSSAYQEIRNDASLWLPAEPDLKKWAKSDYDRYMGHPESLIHETVCGLMVRSKAESMIADALTLSGIPFRYEQTIFINGKTYAPDFTLLHPITRKLMYWEHFGKMDDPQYVQENAVKIMDYRQAGIKLHHNFLITLEKKGQPLSAREIQDIIDLHLLRS